MKTYFYLLFLLSLSLAAQTKDAQKRLYYNPMEGDPAYAMGKYKLKLQGFEETFDTLTNELELAPHLSRGTAGYFPTEEMGDDDSCARKSYNEPSDGAGYHSPLRREGNTRYRNYL